MELALDACRTTLCESTHLFHGCHCRIAGKGGQQRAVGPTQFERFLWRLTGEQSIKESGGESIPAADAIEHVELRRRRDIGFAVDPYHRTPTVPIRRVYFAQRRRDDSDLRMLCHNLTDHPQESRGIESGLGGHFWTRNAKAFL